MKLRLSRQSSRRIFTGKAMLSIRKVKFTLSKECLKTQNNELTQCGLGISKQAGLMKLKASADSEPNKAAGI